MGRRRHFNVVRALLLLSIFAGADAFAQGNNRGRGGSSHHQPRITRRLPNRMMQLSPQDRQIFQRNAERWLRMTPQQQSALRERERTLQAQRRREAEAFMRDSGMRLDNGARQQFEQRYFQERIRIERALRQETESKRQQELQQLRERLKNESQSPAPNTSAQPRD